MKDALNTLEAAFFKNKVFDMEQLKKVIQTTSRRTVFRYLQKLHCLTSYTHNGKYYTIPNIAQFDKDGFWYFGDIGFSVHGTLMNTLAHIITMSESGKTNSELEKQCRTRVQNSLQNLLKPNKIAITVQTKPCLYVNPDPAVSDRQIKRRTEIGSRRRLPEWVVVEVLVEIIRSYPIEPEIKDVVKRLSKRGSLITHAQVKQVFEENDLEKKTLD